MNRFGAGSFAAWSEKGATAPLENVREVERARFTVLHVTTVGLSLYFLSGQAAFLRRRGASLQAISSPDPESAELVVSAEYAVGEASKRKITVEEELLRYVAHGILHLLGYDDHRPSDKATMWKRL